MTFTIAYNKFSKVCHVASHCLKQNLIRFWQACGRKLNHKTRYILDTNETKGTTRILTPRKHNCSTFFLLLQDFVK